MRRHRLTSLVLAAASSALFAATLQAAPTPDKRVVEAGRIITMDGPDIVDGLIVIDNGRITAIGPRAEVEAPWDAPVIGGPELTAFPGFVEAHSNRGTDRSNENVDVAPFLSLRDSVDPVNFYFEDCLRWGITTINLQHAYNCVVGGRGMIVRPTGMTVGEMAVRPLHGIKISARPKSGKSAATQAQALRRAFSDLRAYLEEQVQAQRDSEDTARREALFQGRERETPEPPGRPMTGDGWTVDGFELVDRRELDEKQAPMLSLVEGRIDAYIEASNPREVLLALDVARDNGLLGRCALIIDADCVRAIDAIAEAGVPVIFNGTQVYNDVDPVTGESEEVFALEVLEEAGVSFALSSQNSTTNSLWFQAALAIGGGLSREQALAAVTTTPAGILGLGDDVGSLSVGKAGNVVLFTGDPLSLQSWVDKVVIEGEEAYDRTTDLRNRHLLEAQEPRGAAPAAPAPSEQEEDGDEVDEEEGDEQ